MTPKVPRAKNPVDHQQITVLLPLEWVERLDALAKARSQPELTVTRADVVRLVVRRGLEVVEAERPQAPEGKKRR
jgi:hypothetical protein